MATITTNGTDKALAVIDLDTKQPIVLPLNIQNDIMAPITAFLEWIKVYTRTGGIPSTSKAVPGMKIKYGFSPKQTNVRSLEVKVDDTTGKIIGGVFGAPDSDGLFGEIKSTMGDYIITDEVELVAAKYLKHKIAIKDLTTAGLRILIINKLKNWTAEMAEDNLMTLKATFVAAFGTIGNAAKKSGWKYDSVTKKGKRVDYALPVPGASAKIGDRVFSKDYTIDAAGGEAAINDIVDTLMYKERIGLKDGTEPTYGLRYGSVSTNSVVSISTNVNKAIQKAVEKSNNGFLSGVGVDKEKGKITSISYHGKTVRIGHIIADMPQKNSKDFNWFIVERGDNGAISMPSTWVPGVEIRQKDMISKTVEAIGLLMNFKLLQPELMFSSFKKT